MILKEFRNNFNDQLSGIYPKTEVDTFFFLLIEEYLNLQRIDVSLQPNFEVNEEKRTILQLAVERLLKEEPLQYIIGKTEFYGLPFYVNENVLIPRPETEELIEWILTTISSSQPDRQTGAVEKSLSILDIGTGSGCIPITLKSHLHNTIVSAIDVSKEALAIAQKNTELNDVQINFIQQDILNINNLDSVIASETKQSTNRNEMLKQVQHDVKFDVIVSNPPYVRELEKEEIKKNVLDNEPHLALFVEDNNPLIFYDKIADLAKIHLKKDGLLFFEINQYLGKETVELLKEKGFQNIELKKDLFGNDRMIKASLTNN
ncbi:MAG: peptide chain release factor N(5)-glutamine methyltransferase [Flavobacteriaceae bacterium]